MRYVTISMLLFTQLIAASCATFEPTAQRSSRTFEYRTMSGKDAHFDMATLTLTTPDGSFRFVSCEAGDYLCLDAPGARVEIPKDCLPSGDYIERKGVVRFLSLEGLSGNIFKFDSRNAKFAYGFHPRNGLVAFIVVPTKSSVTVDPPNPDVVPYLYQSVDRAGPFACGR